MPSRPHTLPSYPVGHSTGVQLQSVCSSLASFCLPSPRIPTKGLIPRLSLPIPACFCLCISLWEVCLSVCPSPQPHPVSEALTRSPLHQGLCSRMYSLDLKIDRWNQSLHSPQASSRVTHRLVTENRMFWELAWLVLPPDLILSTSAWILLTEVRREGHTGCSLDRSKVPLHEAQVETEFLCF